MAEVMKAWQCIGCGRIEGPQTCIGICQDRPVQFVYASDYEEAVQETACVRERAQALEAFVRQLALARPRNGAWEDSYRAVQARAKRLLAEI